MIILTVQMTFFKILGLIEAGLVFASIAFLQTSPTIPIYWTFILAFALALMFVTGAFWQSKYSTTDLKERIRKLELLHEADEKKLREITLSHTRIMGTLEQAQERLTSATKLINRLETEISHLRDRK